MCVHSPSHGPNGPYCPPTPTVRIWALCLSLALVGCGGGGGAPDTTTPTAPATDTAANTPTNAPISELPEDWQTDPQAWATAQEFINQPALATIHAEKAYARGITDLALTPQEFIDFDLTSWLTHGQNRTSPSTHPFLARFEQTDKASSLSDLWKIVPLTLRCSGVRQDLPPLGSIGFAATVRRRRGGRFGFGWVGEWDGLMNTIGEGAVKFGPSHSVLLSVGQDYNLTDTLSLSTNAHLTFSNLQPLSDSLIRGTEQAVSSAFDVGLDYQDFSMQLSQPIYFETGVLKLSRPTARRADGVVVF